MSTLYWVTVLGNLNALLFAVALIAGIIGGLLFVFCFCEEYDDDRRKYIKAAKPCLVTFIIAVVGIIFAPTTKQLYAIYGVGTVIDYAKSSPEVQKLPDNAVKALNKYLESVTEDSDESE